jgi:hypothetical protein
VKEKKGGIKGVTRHADVKSPLKPMHMNPIEEPPTPKHKSPHGMNPSPDGASVAKMKKGAKDSKRRKRNPAR